MVDHDDTLRHFHGALCASRMGVCYENTVPIAG
jgi:hypothetical protein